MLHEARAIGLAGGDGEQARASSGDLALAIVASTVTLLKNAGEGDGDEREDSSVLHLGEGESIR